MDSPPPERGDQLPPGATARKRAFAAAAAVIAAATGVMLALGPPGDGDEMPPPSGERELTIVAPPQARPEPAGRLPGAAAVRDARAVATRFALAFFARESGRMDGHARRDLRATTARSLWPRLRRAVRVTPAWQPSPARFERLSGVSETAEAGVIEATVAYRRGGARRYMSMLLMREGGRWRVLLRGW